MKRLDLKNPFGAPIYHEEVVSSTSDIARILASKNEPHGTVITADFQESGRGRLNRPWAAERGKNLLFTVLLRYRDYASVPEALTLRTGLAVSLAIEDLIHGLHDLDSIENLTGNPASSLAASIEIKIKWPNDVMIGLRKAAGILTEADGKNVFIGIGVNTAQTEFPEEYRRKAVSIIQVAPALPINVNSLLLERILQRLYSEIENEGAHSLTWRERILKRLYKLGETVSFANGMAVDWADDHAGSGNHVTGTLSGIGTGGELLIIPSGEDKGRSFVTGELLVYDVENQADIDNGYE